MSPNPPAIDTRPTVEDVLLDARTWLDRLDPTEAAAAQQAGALLVDIRPEHTRRIEGEIPGSLVLERNVLEWRLDPTSPARLPEPVDHDRHVVLVCNEGYASSLAAAGLQLLGLHRATDLVGGFRAWRARGLPVNPGPTTSGRYVDGGPTQTRRS